MNVRCQWLPTVRVRNHIRSHVGQHFQIRLADFVDLAQRGVVHNSSPSSALHGTFDVKKNGDFKVGFDHVEGDQKYRSRFQKEGSAVALLQAARVTRTVPLLPLQPVLAECAHRL